MAFQREVLATRKQRVLLALDVASILAAESAVLGLAYLVERIPMGRPGRLEDLEGPVIFLASDASAYVTGQTLLVDGGISTGSIRALPRTR